VGINDDVTNTSLPLGPTINTQDPEVTQAHDITGDPKNHGILMVIPNFYGDF
jgi:hypothetical protein